ncbi:MULTISPECIES: DUF3592 domain-containing protein [Cohaesibacter]|uniref:DUF3592 domain-containing protein n=1 Tax=Cohaesibacter TaxID=655352 RepID=UPI0010FD05BF|nr:MULTISPECIES: DUF3592 domain-containing protein [Cohaesibacter]TLP47107.1 DUF3592 domain-containing protein [Cohaesibacter sp. CAU 1516]
MRYQPAYIYPGTKGIERQPIKEPARWRLQRPQLSVDQRGSVRLLRFFLVVVGFALFVVGLAHFSTAFTAQNWKQVTAVVMKSDVVRMTYEDGTPVFTADIQYQYLYDGTLYTGQRLSVRPIRSHSPGEVKHQIAAYSVGRTVLAHVNPDRPEKAFLKTNPDSYLYALVIPGLLMILLSVAIGQVIYMHALRKQREAWRYGEFKGLRTSAA